jgi:DNA-binding CsgD family transcriptional regulator/tetratricopeptide (TPR) repeat protein
VRSPSDAPVNNSVSSGRLLERAPALATLRAALEAARSGDDGRVVFVGGEAGVGKTSLVRAFAGEQDASTRVLWGACDSLFTPRPLGPLLDVAADAGGRLAQVLMGDARPHDVARALLADLGEHEPAVVVVEDVHWADEATLDVIRLLARRMVHGALLVCTYRDDELDRDHPLRLVLGELATAGNVERLALEPLSSSAIAELGARAGVDAAELHRRTGGNPFFATEVLAAAQDGIPDTVRDAVLARAARLGADARALLDVAAIFPLEIELWLLEAIAGAPGAALDECVSAGMLSGAGPAVAFRHELARIAIEESLAPARALALHRAALSALQEPPGGEPDLARLAHHAEAAGDVGAVLRFAPAAGARATSLGAHREAAAQYARALHCAGPLADAVRADLLEQRALACYATGLTEDAIAAQEEAVTHRRAAGDARAEGDALRSLGRLLGFAGQAEAGAAVARDAVAVLERLPPGRELAMAYATLSQRALNWEDTDEAIEWGTKALELAGSLGDDETVVYALTNLAGARFRQSVADGRRDLEHALELARRAGTDDQVARILHGLAHLGLRYRRLDVVGPAVAEGLGFCAERGLDLWRAHFGACEARLELDSGRWDAAESVAQRVEDDPRGWWIPRLMAQSARGLAAARRGDAGAGDVLDRAWRSAEPSGELSWVGHVAAARAEAAWLDGDAARVAAVSEPALELARRHDASWVTTELACWRRRAGLQDVPRPSAASAEPYALELAGDWQAAAAWWRAAGCPYEAALALSDDDDFGALRQSLDELQALGAAPAARIVARRLRSRGERGLPRGPRTSTRGNPAGLTGRELDVMAHVAQGLRNAQIAERLFLSEKTVDHHVSAILRKLGVRSRGEATRAAERLGIVAEDGERDPPNMGNPPVSVPPGGP